MSHKSPLVTAFLLAFLLAGCYRVPITGRNAFIVTSEQQENELGTQAYQQQLAGATPSRDTRATAITERVAKRIAEVANRPDFQWEFHLVESKEANAFCLPGGKIAVYTGILPVAKNEASLAIIVGHEVGHAVARHAGQRITLLYGEQLTFGVLSSLLGGPDGFDKKVLEGALGLGAQVGINLPFSREQESEADIIGLHYAASAGYDPAEGPKLWQRMDALSQSAPPTFLSDHPASQARAKSLEAELPQVQPLYDKSPKYGLGETL